MKQLMEGTADSKRCPRGGRAAGGRKNQGRRLRGWMLTGAYCGFCGT